MRLYDAIYQFLIAWFPPDKVIEYNSQVELVTMLITAGLVLFIGYNLLFGWWWKGRK